MIYMLATDLFSFNDGISGKRNVSWKNCALINLYRDPVLNLLTGSMFNHPAIMV